MTPIPETIIDHALGHGISGAISGFMGGFMGIMGYWALQRKSKRNAG
ncbi:hypothetical protein [uncultured Draconibacterium sp.]